MINKYVSKLNDSMRFDCDSICIYQLILKTKKITFLHFTQNFLATERAFQYLSSSTFGQIWNKF